MIAIFSADDISGSVVVSDAANTTLNTTLSVAVPPYQVLRLTASPRNLLGLAWVKLTKEVDSCSMEANSWSA